MPKVRLIDANAAADKIMRATENRADDLNIIGITLMIGIARMLRDENDFPTVEPEVRHGRWIPNGKRSVFGDLEYLCSECSRKITVNWAVMDPSEYNAFCHGCGARMDVPDTNVGDNGGAGNE